MAEPLGRIERELGSLFHRGSPAPEYSDFKVPFFKVLVHLFPLVQTVPLNCAPIS